MKAGTDPKKEPNYYQRFRTFSINLHRAGITSEEYNSFHIFKTKMNVFHDQRGRRNNIDAMGTLAEVAKCFDALKQEVSERNMMKGEVQRLIEEYAPELARLPEKFGKFLRKVDQVQPLQQELTKKNTL